MSSPLWQLVKWHWPPCASPFPVPYYVCSWDIPMDFDTDILNEIEDSNGEIFDIPEFRDDEFDMNEYLNGNYDYWWLLQSLVEWFSPPFPSFGILKTAKVAVFMILHPFILLIKNDSWHSQLYWRRCNLSGICGSGFDSHYPGNFLPSLFQFSAS